MINTSSLLFGVGVRRWLALYLCVALALSPLGCHSLPLAGLAEKVSGHAGTAKDKPPAESVGASSQAAVSTGASGTHGVRLDGSCLPLGEQDQPAVTSDKFLSRITELLDGNRSGAARRWVGLYPDIALQSLREATSTGRASKELQFLAGVHDQRVAARGADKDGWTNLVRQLKEQPGAYRSYLDRRIQVTQLFDQGRFSEAAALQLPQTCAADSPLPLRIDAWRSTGLAFVLAERPAEAVTAFERAVALAGNLHLDQAAELQLLLSDARRRAGQNDAANATWGQAVDCAGTLLTQADPVFDPMFWERAVYLRPANAAWPQQLLAPLIAFNERQRTPAILPAGIQPVTNQSASRPAVDVQLWMAIGSAHYERGEPQAALVAYKKAEVLLGVSGDGERLQLAQARTLAALNQPAGALAMLVKLANSQDLQVAHASAALLGTMKLQSGNVAQGLALLRRAVEGERPVDWCGRGEAEADLGLALLMNGEEPSGLQWLHSAQQRFQASGDIESLLKSIDNEASYLEHQGKKQAVLELRQRLASLG